MVMLFAFAQNEKVFSRDAFPSKPIGGHPLAHMLGLLGLMVTFVSGMRDLCLSASAALAEIQRPKTSTNFRDDVWREQSHGLRFSLIQRHPAR